MQDEPEVLQHVAFDLMTPMPGAYLPDSLDVDPVTENVTYLLAERDRALVRPGDEFAKRAGVTQALLPATHEFLHTHPGELAEALLSV